MDISKLFCEIYLSIFALSTSYFKFGDCACTEKTELLKKESFSNKLITEFSLWSKSGVESSAGCATYCGRDSQCVSFFYNPETDVCTGHTLQFYSTEPSIEQKGSLYYSMAVDKTDCADIQMNDPDSPDGVYIINPLDGRGPFRVFCDMTTDGGGWTMGDEDVYYHDSVVFLRQEDGSEDFNREWDDFKKGFGNPASEFWLGNDAINRLTAAKPSELRVDMEDWEDQSRYATYNEFSVGDEASNYLLTVTGYSGTVGDSFSHHSGMFFSTIDKDNDPSSTQDCASLYTGGWWYNDCHRSHLTGTYNDTNYGKGVNWRAWHTFTYSLKRAHMKLRPN